MATRIGTNEQGGTFHAQGTALAALLRARAGIKDIEVVATPAASIGNAEGLEAGNLEFAFMASNWVGPARRGEPPFAAAVELRMAAPANAGPMFFVARAGSGLATVDDLRGRRVAVGRRGGGMAQHVRTIFAALGIPFAAITPVYLDFAEGADALAAGTVDAQWQCPVPNPVMTALAERADVQVLDYAEGALERVLAAVPFYRPVVLAAGAFRGLAADSAQVGVLNVLVTHARIEADLVQRVVATMIAHGAALAAAEPLYRGLPDLFAALRGQGRAGVEPDGVPLHPGALAAWRGAGYLG